LVFLIATAIFSPRLLSGLRCCELEAGYPII
jgi:hypothetical protein